MPDNPSELFDLFYARAPRYQPYRHKEQCVWGSDPQYKVNHQQSSKILELLLNEQNGTGRYKERREEAFHSHQLLTNLDIDE